MLLIFYNSHFFVFEYKESVIKLYLRFMKKLRLLLFPFAGLYYLVTYVRNKFFDNGILSFKTYETPVICIGNLSTGGTGKSPMTEYVIRLLKKDYKVATLSRGYGRTTKGYLDVVQDAIASQVGDEPLQFAQKFNDVRVAVCENRQLGIATLLKKTNAPGVIILDDAFQHRKVKAGFYILLTSYDDLYSDDFLLPAGNLREPRHGSFRANSIVVTKCPENLSSQDQQEIEKKLKLADHQSLYFAKIKYNEMLHSKNGMISLDAIKDKKVTVVTGIANPRPFLNYLTDKNVAYKHKSYPDHHNFTDKEIIELDALDFIITTEKDYVRLQRLLTKVVLYYIPIEVDFISKKGMFDVAIKKFMGE